jgi:chromate transporter
MATLHTNRLGLPLALAFVALTFIAIGLLRWPLIWVLAGSGSVAIALAWMRWR